MLVILVVVPWKKTLFTQKLTSVLSCSNDFVQIQIVWPKILVSVFDGVSRREGWSFAVCLFMVM